MKISELKYLIFCLIYYKWNIEGWNWYQSYKQFINSSFTNWSRLSNHFIQEDLLNKYLNAWIYLKMTNLSPSHGKKFFVFTIKLAQLPLVISAFEKSFFTGKFYNILQSLSDWKSYILSETSLKFTKFR